MHASLFLNNVNLREGWWVGSFSSSWLLNNVREESWWVGCAEELFVGKSELGLNGGDGRVGGGLVVVVGAWGREV